jgi:peptide-methionine (S)-S-oxide reductase
MSPEQEEVAKAYIAQLNAARVFPAPIATKIEPDRGFVAAEDYHQDFLTLNPTYPYIVFNDLPKIGSLKKLFPNRYRADPVLVSAGRS